MTTTSPIFDLFRGDSLTVLRSLPDASVDSVVTDPPYGLSKEPDIAEVLTHWLAGDDYTHTGSGFMGKSWDSFVPGPSVFREIFRVLKPGGHMACFAGSRTVDLMGISIRLAGFEIRDQMQWIYGSGFPKSMDVSKAIDKAAGATREVVGSKLDRPGYHLHGHQGGEAYGAGLSSSTPETRLASSQITAPATSEAAEWEGWGTALKPGHEPIVLARKPLAEGTVVRNVLAHGTGAINIDASRIPTGGELLATPQSNPAAREGVVGSDLRISGSDIETFQAAQAASIERTNTLGRWPANVILSHHPECEDGGACHADCPLRIMDEQSGERKAGGKVKGTEPSRTGDNGIYSAYGRVENAPFTDSGGASRFFYCAKASRSERNEGVTVEAGNRHPTVKPIKLMRHLVGLVTPPGGTVLDAWLGSGTTLAACAELGFDGIGIDRDDEGTYLPIAEDRISHRGGTVRTWGVVR